MSRGLGAYRPSLLLVLAKQILDTPVGYVLPSVKALRVADQQHLDAVAGSLSHLGGVDSGVEPGGKRRVPKVVRPTRERRGRDSRREREEPGLLPDAVVGRGRDDRALLAEEEPTVVAVPKVPGVRGAWHKLGRNGTSLTSSFGRFFSPRSSWVSPESVHCLPTDRARPVEKRRAPALVGKFQIRSRRARPLQQAEDHRNTYPRTAPRGDDHGRAGSRRRRKTASRRFRACSGLATTRGSTSLDTFGFCQRTR